MIESASMRLTIKQFLAIAGLTVLDAFRQPITFLITLGSVAFIGLLPVLLTHTLGESQRLVRDSALSLHFVAGLVLGACTASAALGQDIRKGTAPAILCKPVDRAVFLIAKYVGVAVTAVAFSTLVFVSAILSVRTAATDFNPDWWGIGPLFAALALGLFAAGIHHYFARGPFVSKACAYVTAGIFIALVVSANVHSRAPGANSGLSWNLLPAGALITLAILVLSALAVTLATRLEIVPVLTICALVLMLGLISDYIVGQLPPAARLLRFAVELIPNWQNFWTVDALNREGIPARYVAHACGYAGLYLAAILSAGIFAFRRMEVR